MATIHEAIDEVAAEICKNYCKYPQIAHDAWLKDKTQDETDYLTEHYCNDCPLVTKV